MSIGKLSDDPPRRNSDDRPGTLAKAAFYFLIAFLSLALVALLLPAVPSHREASPRTQCRNNLKQLGLALHNYHDDYGSFPPAYVADTQGRRLHSWRVLILPYLGEEELYRRYDFSKPWDSAANLAVQERMPDVFRCPAHAKHRGSGTQYCAVSGPDTMFPGAQPSKISGFEDGLATTLMVGEITDARIPWTSPFDIDVSVTPKLGDPRGFSGSHHSGQTGFLFGDGATRFLVPAEVSPADFHKLTHTNDGAPNGDL